MQQTKQGRVPMNVSRPLTHARSRAGVADSVEIPQYSRSAIVAIWAAAALPMAAAAWLVTLVESDAGKAFLSGAWGWYALLLVNFAFNTVLGEELLFRGFLLPRMNGAFGRGDWVANGVLFTGYHLHVPWGMPASLLDMFFLAYPTKRYRSAWIGIAVHSAQSVVLAILVLMLVI